MRTRRDSSSALSSNERTTLRGRIAFVVLAAILLLAAGAALMVETLMQNALEGASLAEALAVGRSFTSSAIDHVLLDERLELHAQMRATMEAEPDIIYIYIEDENGIPLVSTFGSSVPPGLTEVNRPAPDDEYTAARLSTEEGRILDVAMPMLTGNAGIVHVGVSEADVTAALARTRLLLAAVTLGMVGIGALISFGSGRLIAQPLERLAQTAGRVGDGDLSVRAELGSDREVAAVAEAFNQMLDALQDDIVRREAAEAELKASRDELELRVARRTADLADANEELTSMNEEITAANEELTAMNEELVSLNEDMVRANRDLEEANRVIAEATRAKSDFLASMSHELRTPLNSVIGFSDIMLREMAGPLTSEQRRQLEMVKSSGSYLLTLINDVLDLARIDRGHLQPALSTVDVCDIGERAFTAFRALGESKSLEMRFRHCAKRCEIRTDPVRLEQILVNLLGNAVKFTAEGWIELGIGCADGMIEMTVSDSGRGIPAADLDRVFDEFYQVRSSEGGNVGGTGLGLAISRRIAEALGGTLTAVSEVGAGSAFTVRLPKDGPGA